PSPTTSAENTVSQLDEEWKTYSDNQYHFEIQYYQPGWALVSKVGGPDLPYATLKEPKNLITGRVIGWPHPSDTETAAITIAIYGKPSNKTIVQWLSQAYGIELSN